MKPTFDFIEFLCCFPILFFSSLTFQWLSIPYRIQYKFIALQRCPSYNLASANNFNFWLKLFLPNLIFPSFFVPFIFALFFYLSTRVCVCVCVFGAGGDASASLLGLYIIYNQSYLCNPKYFWVEPWEWSLLLSDSCIVVRQTIKCWEPPA